MSGLHHQKQQQACSFFKSFDWRRVEDLRQSEKRFDRFIIVIVIVVFVVVVVEQRCSFWSPMPSDFGSLHQM